MDERKFEVIRKDVSQSKLTIATDRVTLKIPNNMDARYVDPITQFAQEICTQITTKDDVQYAERRVRLGMLKQGFFAIHQQEQRSSRRASAARLAR